MCLLLILSFLCLIANSISSQEKIEHDHVYPNSDGNPVTVVLYGEIGTSEFYTIHQQLVKLANKGKVHYILRHFVKV